MTDKELAKMIVDYIDWWERPYDNYTKNYKETLETLKTKDGVQSIYDYIYSEDECGKIYTMIINELKERLQRDDTSYEKEITTYEKTFDYEDMKVAMIVGEFYTKHEDEMTGYELYESLIDLCVEIREAWNNLEKYKDCNIEEYAYIQLFAENYLIKKFLGGK